MSIEFLIELKKALNHREYSGINLASLLAKLKRVGYRPGLYLRGRYWRAHLNCADSFWHDGKTPITAFKGAIESHIRHYRTHKELPPNPKT